MLGIDKEGLKELSKKDKIVREYMEEVNEVNENPKFREYISYEEDQRKIQNSLLYEAEQKGIEQGINSSKIEMAKDMIKDNMDVDIISKYTKLSKEEIEKLF